MFLTKEQVRKITDKFYNESGVTYQRVATFIKVPVWKVIAYFKLQKIKNKIKQHKKVIFEKIWVFICVFTLGWIVAEYLHDLHVYRTAAAMHEITQAVVDFVKICEFDKSYCDFTFQTLQDLVGRI